ncbi:hypothetical protein Leryth_019691 [Lithospermum erythrorhizon]|nr:hypothetical protein Leryth_019691 [Lithospermum erythrorhizon]
MAGLLAWASEVVGRGGKSDEDDDPDSIPLIFTPEQQSYALDLDIKAASLSRSIQDLRLRLPPPDISQRLPHLHAHSLASNAALALQLNAHSTTKEQTQLREVTLQEENAEYENAISNCENKIQEKMQEADSLQSRLKELELIEENLKTELKNAEVVAGTTRDSSESMVEYKSTVKAQDDAEVSKYELLDKLESKRKEMQIMEETVQHLEKKWAAIQENALKQPSPVQREKILDKQLHSLIEQLAAKQAQAEGLVGEIRVQEMELEKLEGLRRRAEASNTNLNTGRTRLGRSSFGKEPVSADYIVDPHQKPPFGRNENLQRLMLLRSAFVIYILALHVLVFIKISF